VPESRRHFKRRVDKALDDPNLQRALTSGLTGIRGRRNLAFETFDFAKGQAELKERRRANLDRLPELAEQFQERLEAAGGVVHYAKDAADARDIIGQICWNAARASSSPGAPGSAAEASRPRTRSQEPCTNASGVPTISSISAKPSSRGGARNDAVRAQASPRAPNV
jgi:hypothetical protein